MKLSYASRRWMLDHGCISYPVSFGIGKSYFFGSGTSDSQTALKTVVIYVAMTFRFRRTGNRIRPFCYSSLVSDHENILMQTSRCLLPYLLLPVTTIAAASIVKDKDEALQVIQTLNKLDIRISLPFFVRRAGNLKFLAEVLPNEEDWMMNQNNKKLRCCLSLFRQMC